MEFLDALKREKARGHIPFITDIKCYSPKEGDLMRRRDPVRLAKQLEEAGVCALSVVTEEKSFHGSMELLRRICAEVRVPVLRKDFITCEADLDETAAAGAKAILLMVSCLGEEKLTGLYHAARNKGLTPFVETHTYEEFCFAQRLGAELVGINNRDITVLERDDGTVAHSGSILHKAARSGNAPAGKAPFFVVESALSGGSDVRAAVRNGADAVLVGTAVLQAEDPVKRLRTMTRRCGIKICGLQTADDVKACLEQEVDICGTVVQYPVPVRWNLDEHRARQLLTQAKEGPFVPRCCIVTGGSPSAVTALAKRLRPELVQLHYKETLEQTRRIAEELAEEGIGVLRSIPSDGAARREMYGTEDLSGVCSLLADTKITGVLFDSRDADNAAIGGGSILHTFGDGLHEPVRILRDAGKEICIGGGITPDNAREVYEALCPDHLDIMTGAEGADGYKSAERIAQLTQAVR